MQMSALSEKQRTTEKRAFGHHYHSPALCRCKVDDALYCLCLQQSRVVFHAIGRDDILASECINVYTRRIVKPCRNVRSVGKAAARRSCAGSKGHKGKHYCQYLLKKLHD